MILSKEDIKKLYNKYRNEPFGVSIRNINGDFETLKIIKIWSDDEKEPIAQMIISKEDNEDDYFVNEADSKYKGIGKLLYYIAMHSIYPLWLRPDIDGFSTDAKRLWDIFESLDYVESQDNKYWLSFNDNLDKPDIHFSSKKFRFSFKNENNYTL